MAPASMRLAAVVLVLPWLAVAPAPGDDDVQEPFDDSQLVLGAAQNIINDPTDDISCINQACNPKEGHYCQYPMRVCREFAPCVGQPGATGHVCLHKNLWPWWPDDVLLFGALFVIGIAAGITGIGGGGLNVPMLMLWSLFDIKEAVPLSHAAIVGNSFVMLCFNSPQRHPSAPTRPLIHYELALLLLPAMLAGSNLGVLVGRIFPPTVLILLSLVLLVFASLKTLAKGRKLAKMARSTREARPTPGSPLLNNPGTGGESPSLAAISGPPVKIWPSLPQGGQSNSTSNSGVTVPSAGCGAADDEREFALHRSWSGTLMQVGTSCALSPTRRPTAPSPLAASLPPMRMPWACIAVMLVISVVVSVDSVMMKREPICSATYWITFALLYPIAVVAVFCGSSFMKKLALYHEERHERVEGEVVVTPRTLLLYPGAMTLVGMVAGLLGLGGGEFMVPLMLEMGLQPRVAGATSGFIMILTTMTDIAHYWTTGVLGAFIQYCISVCIVAACGGFVGLLLRDTQYVKDNSHLIVYLLSGLLLFSGVLLGFRGLYHAQLDWQFASLCPA